MTTALLLLFLWSFRTVGAIDCETCVDEACGVTLSMVCNPAISRCITATVIDLPAGTTQLVRGCASDSLCPSNGPLTFEANLGPTERLANARCCDTDNCNNDLLPALTQQPPNGNECFFCVLPSICQGIITCRGSASSCFQTTDPQVLGCASPNLCNAGADLSLLRLGVPQTSSCCIGPLCNDPTIPIPTTAPTTAAPTTAAPTTPALTTAAPTTAAPTTAAPTTPTLTTAAPTTAAPTTAAPTTAAPTTAAPTTPTPTVVSLTTTVGATTAVPTTAGATTAVPTTAGTTTAVPTTAGATTAVPTTAGGTTAGATTAVPTTAGTTTAVPTTAGGTTAGATDVEEMTAATMSNTPMTTTLVNVPATPGSSTSTSNAATASDTSGVMLRLITFLLGLLLVKLSTWVSIA